MSKTAIGIIGKDQRLEHLEQYLIRRGYMVHRQEDFTPAILTDISYLIGAPSFYRDGKLPYPIEDACINTGVEVLNYMTCEDFLLRNAHLTAEGLLSIIIQNTVLSLDELTILLLGLGRCGRAIERVLKQPAHCLDAYDTVPDDISLDMYHVLINTIPEPVIKREHLQQLKTGCVLFEIASRPGGFDKMAVEELNLSLISCPGIPGKYAPASAGNAIGRAVEGLLNRKEECHENEGRTLL